MFFPLPFYLREGTWPSIFFFFFLKPSPLFLFVGESQFLAGSHDLPTTKLKPCVSGESRNP